MNNSLICDFMECEYKCKPNNSSSKNISYDTYNENFMLMNLDKIMQRIRRLFKLKYSYEKEELIMSINAIKKYPIEQIIFCC